MSRVTKVRVVVTHEEDDGRIVDKTVFERWQKGHDVFEVEVQTTTAECRIKVTHPCGGGPKAC